MHVAIKISEKRLSVTFQSEALKVHLRIKLKDTWILSSLEKLNLGVARGAFLRVVSNHQVQKLSLLFGYTYRRYVSKVVVRVYSDGNGAHVLELVWNEVVNLERFHIIGARHQINVRHLLLLI